MSKWRRFYLYDDFLFKIDMGNKFDKSKMTQSDPSVDFIGRANNNNGITASVDKVTSVKPYNAGCLTVSLGGEYLGSCFIQSKPFYTSQNVIVLIPKWDMSFEVKQFISVMIFRESRTHYRAFQDELNRHVKRDFSFFLPIKEDGTPNWDYMENYQKAVHSREVERLRMLQNAV